MTQTQCAGQICTRKISVEAFTAIKQTVEEAFTADMHIAEVSAITMHTLAAPTAVKQIKVAFTAVELIGYSFVAIAQTEEALAVVVGINVAGKAAFVVAALAIIIEY